ncbi:hypothetical protein J7E83_19765 [Arthrobacter sp. ISL-48]|uniref:hypothetical protein n=1 Tax=Arthrobacter sp. ISL-48 TaxID=2819110 RepID=UPI001BE6FB20|nr:hypothetical protein [Arthrobacter sp. ISL-48]MBT2534324.1 hypothetical protein [Arthrobacter sp. ISL-48]
MKPTAEVIAAYEPKPGRVPSRVWAAIGPFVREVAGCLGYMAPDTMRNYIHAIAYFVFWAHEQGVLLDVEIVFTPSRVERYVQTSTAHLVPSSRATRRAALARVGREVTRRAPWPTPGMRFQMHQLQPPYSTEETDGYLQMASQQSTPFKRRVATAQLALGLGGGLQAQEYLSVGNENLVLHGDIFMLDIPGSRARKVPLHQRYADLLLDIGEKHPGEPFIAPLTEAKPSDRLDRVLRLPEYPRVWRPTTNRLRTTWLVRMLRSGCNLSEVHYMSGLQGTKSLIELLPYIEFRDVHDWFAEAAAFHD